MQEIDYSEVGAAIATIVALVLGYVVPEGS